MLKWLIFIFIVLIIGLGCFQVKKETTSITAVATSKFSFSALPQQIIAPKNNPITSEKVELGRLLFYDPILSGDKDVACATCHHGTTGYAEYRDLSIGVNGKGFGIQRKFNTPNDIPFVKRNSQTILNVAFNGIENSADFFPKNAPMFWDLRTKSLELQALEPIKAFEEMRGHSFAETEILDEVIQRLRQNKEYQTLFKNAFDNEHGEAITIENLGKAIASFERILVTNNSRFDEYMRGNNDAISLSEKEGFRLFKEKGCETCHHGPMFSDYKIHVIGAPDNNKLTELDKGFEDQNGFRTPTLRNLHLTAPYMHNGSMNTLKEVLEFYEDVAGGKSRNDNIPPQTIDTLIDDITIKVKDMGAIISFLNCLNDNDFDKKIPSRVPSGLEVGGEVNIE